LELILDTHILLWFRAASERLSERDKGILVAATRRLVSAASLWKIGILTSRKKVNPGPRWFELPDGFELLPVSPEHCRMVADLPFHHRDPFDRMLVAQAKVERLGVLTRDEHMSHYGRERDGLLIPD
jgi:PIN domain nuclease of toxin-antitoxin system